MRPKSMPAGTGDFAAPARPVGRTPWTFGPRRFTRQTRIAATRRAEWIGFILKRSKFSAALIIATIFSAPAVSADKPFVTVNGVAVSQATADLFMASGNLRGVADTPALRKDIREELIRRELMLQEAKSIGIDNKPEVAAETEAEKQKMIDHAEAVKQTIINRAYVRAFVKQHPVTEEQLKAYYDANRAKGGNAEYLARHILVKNKADAKAIIARLDKGEKFEDLAKQSIDTGTAPSGGNLDWSSPAKFVKPFADALTRLKKANTTLFRSIPNSAIT